MKFKALGFVALSFLEFTNSTILPVQDTGSYVVSTVLGQKFDGDVKVAFKDDMVSVTGCNINSAQLTYPVNKQSFNVGLFFSTKKFCQQDRDSQILDYIKFAKSYQINGNEMEIKAQNGETIFELYKQGTDKIEVQTPAEEQEEAPIPAIPLKNKYRFFIEGKDYPPKEAELTNKDLIIEGCNKYTIPYSVNARRMKFGQPKIEAKGKDKKAEICKEDEPFLQAVKNCETFEWINYNLIHLKNQKKQTVAYLQPPLTHFYSLSHNYREFQGKYLAKVDDPVVKRIKQYAGEHYSHYVESDQVTSAFKFYLVDDTQYSVIFRGVEQQQNFMLIMNYNPKKDTLDLKSLTLFKYAELEVDNRNCKNVFKGACYDCQEGHKFFKGRCFPVQQECQQYDLDECKKCANKFKVLRGKCVAE